ncbi:hypothetical protein JAAARDRAFT_130011 [Jaapia argillacea MUCL 33604]|uniref:BTB domain-containing protein n=1 Tax=Jaapia argillacea MUCL 33604 TaxID=933084 RepID=A0A067Q519_9AGAM|nr:hypothetical protein JAAARDRAFT_130011 [Jaapia argillacea MUCL 33604]
MGQLSDCILVITVWFKIRLDIPNVKPASVPLSIQNLLTHSLRDGAFIDTKFFVFSKRSESGRVGFPMPLYANSTLLQDKSAYFETLLSDHGFSESANVDIQSPFPANEEPFVDTYDYDSDSDLEVTEDEITPSLSRAAPSSVVRSVSSPRRTRPNEDSERSSTTKGKIIVIKDIAYNTWQSLLFFIYTGDIGFLPLTSERSRSRAEFLEKYYHDYPHRPPPCSPKSMYRLAEKLGFDELEKLAFDAIRVSVSEENIMEEAFSKFTARYRRVLEMQAELLHESYKSPKVLDAIPEKLREIVEGDAPHTLDIITTLFNNLAAH